MRFWRRLGHVGIALLALSHVAPGAAARQPTPEWEVVETTLSAPPRVGEAVEATVRIRINTPPAPDAKLRLEAPPGVRIAGDPVWAIDARVGDTVSHAWTLTADRAGFWALALSGGPIGNAMVSRPVLHAYSSATEAVYDARDPLRAIPEPEAQTRLTASLIDAEHVRVDYTVLFGSPWLSNATVSLGILGSTDLRSVPARNGSATTRAIYRIADGERVELMPTASAVVTFEAPSNLTHVYLSYGVTVACHHLFLARRNDTPQQEEAQDCDAYHAGLHYPTTPAPGGVSAVGGLAAAAVAAARRRRITFLGGGASRPR